jgi:DNA-3-methyladenine glycosylase II
MRRAGARTAAAAASLRKRARPDAEEAAPKRTRRGTAAEKQEPPASAPQPAPPPPPPPPPVAIRVLATQADVDEGVAALAAQCEHMRAIRETLGAAPTLRRSAGGFEGLAKVVVNQQLSLASGRAIWGRLSALLKSPLSAAALLAASDAELRACGLSGPKTRTLRGIATAVSSGALQLEQLSSRPDAEVRAALQQLHGVGPWTADIFLMFALGRADAFAPGDLALQTAAQSALALRSRPDGAALLQIAERWRPWRGVAALCLWEFHHFKKRGAAEPK